MENISARLHLHVEWAVSDGTLLTPGFFPRLQVQNAICHYILLCFQIEFKCMHANRETRNFGANHVTCFWVQVYLSTQQDLQVAESARSNLLSWEIRHLAIYQRNI